MTRILRDNSAQQFQGSPMMLFEENYRLLEALFPHLLNHDGCALRAAGTGPALHLTVLGRTPYTTTIRLHKGFGGDARLLPDLSMDVRLYHDARVAEVLSYQGCERLPAPYEVPLRGRFLSDEKRQVNQLLYQLLFYCARNGYAVAVG